MKTSAYINVIIVKYRNIVIYIILILTDT